MIWHLKPVSGIAKGGELDLVVALSATSENEKHSENASNFKVAGKSTLIV